MNKAQQMRTFLILDQYIVEHSSDKHTCKIHILLAFISEKYNMIVCEFVWLAKMHVEGRNIIWTKDNFLVGS